MKKLKLIALLLAASAMATVFSGCSAFSGGGKYVERTARITYAYDPNEDETHVLYNGKDVGIFDGEWADYYSSADGSIRAILSEDGTLYVANKSEVIEIADDVTDIAISQNGKTIVYADEDNTIHMIGTNGKNEEVISEDQDGYITSLAISPDGKSVVYAFNDDGDIFSVAYIKGEEVELDDEFIGYFIYNGGKTILGEDDDGNICLYDVKSEDMEKIISNDASSSTANADFTEFLYTKNGKIYIYMDGEEYKLGKYSRIAPISLYDQDINNYTTFIGIPLMLVDADGKYGIGYINKKGELEVKADDIDSYFNAIDNAKTIFYLDDGTLYKATAKDDYNGEKLVKKDVAEYAISRDGKKVYYRDNEGVLYLLDGDDKTEIEEDVADIEGVASNGDVYFTVCDEDDYTYTLYRYNGKDTEEIAEDVYSYVYVYPEYIAYTTLDDEDITNGYYISTNNGKTFEAIFED